MTDSGPAATSASLRVAFAGTFAASLPNVLMTPHVSGWTEGMLEARATLIAENIQRAARGDVPLNRVAPAG